MWWMMRQAPIHYVVNDGEHQCTTWWMMRQAPVPYVVDNAASRH